MDTLYPSSPFWTLIAIFLLSVVPALLIAWDEERFWQVGLGIFLVFAGVWYFGFFAVDMSGGSDYQLRRDMETEEFWIHTLIGLGGASIGWQILKENS